MKWKPQDRKMKKCVCFVLFCSVEGGGYGGEVERGPHQTHWLGAEPNRRGPLVTLIAGSLKPIDELIPPCLHVSPLLTNPYTSFTHKPQHEKYIKMFFIFSFLLSVLTKKIN